MRVWVPNCHRRPKIGIVTLYPAIYSCRVSLIFNVDIHSKLFGTTEDVQAWFSGAHFSSNLEASAKWLGPWSPWNHGVARFIPRPGKTPHFQTLFSQVPRTSATKFQPMFENDGFCLWSFASKKEIPWDAPPLFSGTQTGHFFANKNHEPGDENGVLFYNPKIWWFALQLWTTCLLLMLLMGIQSHFDTLIGGFFFFAFFITFVACCGYEVLWMYYGWNAAPVDRWLVYPIIISSFFAVFSKETH